MLSVFLTAWPCRRRSLPAANESKMVLWLLNHQSTGLGLNHAFETIAPTTSRGCSREERNVCYSWWTAQWSLTKFSNQNLRLCTSERLLDHVKHACACACCFLNNTTFFLAWLSCQWRFIHSSNLLPQSPFLFMWCLLLTLSLEKLCSNTE